jgi:hypothetical protein
MKAITARRTVPRPIGLRGPGRTVDNRQQRSVADTVDARLLQGAQQRRVDFLVHHHLPLQPIMLEQQFRRIAENPILPQKRLETCFRRENLLLRVRQPTLDEPLLVSAAELPQFHVVVIQKVEQRFRGPTSASDAVWFITTSMVSSG